MTVYEMEGFLRGKCIPGDLKVNETNAEYLVRKFGELESKLNEQREYYEGVISDGSKRIAELEKIATDYALKFQKAQDALKYAVLLHKSEQEAREIKPAKGEVLVVVSGFTGCGKSAIAGEIEIAMKAIGVPVKWANGDAEKRMTGANWLTAIEMYKPTVRIVEVNLPYSFAKDR